MAARKILAKDSKTIEFAFDFHPKEAFPEYVKRVAAWKAGHGLLNGFVPNTYFVGIVGDQLVGRLSLRHELNDFLRSFGGHIGYVVIPSERNKGYATEMLRLGVLEARKLGIGDILISCDVDNEASRRVIEKNGGVYEFTTQLESLDTQKDVYWIKN